MAIVKAFKWMRMLSDAEEIRKKKEKTKDNSPLEFENYQEALQLRNMAFIELLRARIPFIYIEDDDIVRINLDETAYDMDSTILKQVLEPGEFEELIESPNYDETFNPDKELYVEEQKDDEFERLRKKILSYGADFDETDDFKNDRGSYTKAENRYERDFGNSPASRFVDDYEENYAPKEAIIDYRIDKDGRATVVNTTEYAFMGIEHGVGTTHMALMTAMQLAEDTTKSVALVEINNSNNMRDLGEWISGQRIETNNYPLGNIDVYFGIDYLTFTAMYKDNYDYVIVDFGCYNKKRDAIKEFIRIKNKFIIASGIDWNLPTLEDFYEDYIVDVSHSVVYLIPYLTKDLLTTIEKIVKPNKVYSIPFNMNPFNIEQGTRELINTITDNQDTTVGLLEDKEFVANQKQGFFGRFSKGK